MSRWTRASAARWRSQTTRSTSRRFSRISRLALLAGITALFAAAPAHAALTLTSVGDTFVNPIFATAPPGDGERLMVVLRDGDIRVVKNGITLAQPFLSIPDVDSKDGIGFESGLQSIAFSPDYLTSGRFYVFLTRDDSNPGDPPHAPIEIREYTRSAANPEVADPASKRTVLEIPHTQNASHYGGTLQFGPDGLLYVSVGDGGTKSNAQDTFERLGKLLRFDPRAQGAAPLRAPAGNPFANGGGDPLVYAYGLRNPFRFSFDRQNGDLTLGDVGEQKFEEIDFVPTAEGRGLGADFGWANCEGMVQWPDDTQACDDDGSTLPIHAYDHPTGCAVTGGVVVRDVTLGALQGKYIYGDFCGTYVKSLTVPGATEETLSVSVGNNQLAAFGEDACGRVHIVQLGGEVRRLGDDTNPSSCDLTVTYLPPVDDNTTPRPAAARPAKPRALVFSLGGAVRQRPLRSGNVGVRLRCDGACSARALGRLSIEFRGRRINLHQALGRRSAAGTLRLKLALSARGRRVLRLALRRRRPVRAVLTVRVRDATGKLSLRQRTVRLVR